MLIGDYQSAIDHYEKALELKAAISNHDQPEIARQNTKLGNLYMQRTEKFEKAIEHYRKGLEISTAIGDWSKTELNHSGLGNAYRRLGDYKKAIEHHEEALRLNTENGDGSSTGMYNGNLGNVYECLGEYERAIEYQKKALELSTAPKEEARCNGNLGNVYFAVGEFEKAIGFFETALKLSDDIGDKIGMADQNGNLGNAYKLLGKSQKAKSYYKTGLKISTEIGYQYGIASNNGNLAILYLDLRKYEKTLDYTKKSLEISTSSGDRLAMAINFATLGRAYQLLGKSQMAIKNSLEIRIELGSLPKIAIGKINLGIVYRALGEYDTAVSYLVKSINDFDKIFSNFVPDENKLSYTYEYIVAYKNLLSCFISLKRFESALLVHDLGKAKELHFCIDKQRKLTEKDINDYAATMWNRIDATEEQVGVEEIQTTLEVLENDGSILVFAFDFNHVLHFWILNEEVVFRKSDYTFETIFGLIKKIFDKRNVNITRNSSFCRLFPDARKIDEIIFPSQMPIEVAVPEKSTGKNSGNYDDKNLLRELFELLIDPVKDFLRGNKLIVVPDRQLFFVPFSSLIDENGCYLSQRFGVQITPSLHTLISRVQQPGNSNYGFALLVGNPTDNLPYATEEVKCLSKYWDATPLLGRVARKKVILQHLSGASIIHIAAHGKPNEGEILLAPDSSTKPNSDLLTQGDITSISIKARLVVLCCCHSGQGKVSSEGVVGIARAFLAAGARCVLATLWPIDDLATKEFMENFYKELCQETSVCEALRRAMVFFQQHSTQSYRDTGIWAPFTVCGEDVKFQAEEIEEIKKKSREMFSGFVVLP